MMANVIKLPNAAAKVQKVSNVKVMPNVFTILLNLYKKKQDEIRAKKIKFLTEQAEEFYYSLLETPKIADVDLPEFIYEEQRKKLAKEYASKAMLSVIIDNRVDKCYRERIKELKRRGR